MDKKLLQLKAEASWEEVTKLFKQGVNPYAYTLGFKAGVKDVLENPEFYKDDGKLNLEEFRKQIEGDFKNTQFFDEDQRSDMWHPQT